MGVPFGASHGIGHVLGGTADVPHGYTSCVILPHVLHYNSEKLSLQSQLQQVALALGAFPEVSAATACYQLVEELGLPHTLAEVGVSESMHESIALLSLKDAWTKTNPREMTADGV